MTNPLGTPLSVRPNLMVAPFEPDELGPLEDLLQAKLDIVGLMPNNTNDGRATVAMVATTTDGRKVLIETTWRCMRSAYRALDVSPLGEAEARANGWR